VTRICDEITGDRSGDEGRRGELVCARRSEGRSMGGHPSSGVESEELTEDAGESGSLRASCNTVMGAAALIAGERDVLTP